MDKVKVRVIAIVEYDVIRTLETMNKQIERVYTMFDETKKEHQAEIKYHTEQILQQVRDKQ